MKKFLIGAAAVAFAAGIAVAAEGPVGARRTELQQSPIPGTKFIAFIMKADFDKGGTTNWHTHPGEELGVATGGQLTVQVKGQPDRVIKTGESFRVPANTPHNGIAGGEGYAGTHTYIVESDKPFATPVAKP